MDKEVYEVPSHNGKISTDDLADLLEKLGGVTSSSLAKKLKALQDQRSGSYSPEEAIGELFRYVDRALAEVVSSLFVLEMNLKSDGEPRDVLINLVDDGDDAS